MDQCSKLIPKMNQLHQKSESRKKQQYDSEQKFVSVFCGKTNIIFADCRSHMPSHIRARKSDIQSDN